MPSRSKAKGKLTEGKTGKHVSGRWKTAKDLVTGMPVFVTGCPESHIPLIGVKKNSVYKAMITVDQPVYPCKEYLDIIRKDEEWWAIFLEKVKGLPPFANVQDVSKWFDDNEAPDIPRNFRLGERVPGSMIQLLSPGTAEDGYFLNKDNPEGTLATWLQKPYSPDDFENFVPRKATQGNNSSKRHTLLLNSTNWKIHRDGNVIKRDLEKELQSGKVQTLLDGYTGKLHASTSSIREAVRSARRDRAGTYTQGTVPVLVHLSCFPDVAGLYALLPTATEQSASLPSEVIKAVSAACKIKTPLNALSHLTPAGLKSVIQKIIRVRPTTVSFVLPKEDADDYLVPAEDMLFLSCVLLATHTGSFVPDISSFVSGAQSFFKRLVVTCYEDAYPANTQRADCELAAAAIRALVCKETRDWVCPASDLLRFLTLAKSSLDSTKALVFNHTKTKPSLQLVATDDGDGETMQGHSIVSIVMDSLRSFQTDLNMIRDVAEQKKERFQEISPRDLQRATQAFASCKGNHILGASDTDMPIWHALDHHCSAHIAYFLDDTNISVEEDGVSSSPFKNLFQNIWDYSSRLNPRRKQSYVKDYSLARAHAFNHELKWGQRMLWLAMVKGNHFKRPLVLSGRAAPVFRSVQYSLHKDWLHAMIGHVQVKVGSVFYYCTVLSESPIQLAVSRKPARGLKEEEMKEDLKNDVVERGIQKLEQGVPLIATKYRPPGTRGMYAKLVEKSFFHIVDKPSGKPPKAKSKHQPQPQTWEEMRHVTFQVPLVHPQAKNMEIAIVSTSKEGGVEEDFEKSLETVCLTASMDTLRRFLQLADGYKNVVAMPGIGREGGGTTEGLPKRQDIDVFHFILRLSVSCPGAIKLDKRTQRKFLVTHPMLFWYIRDEIVRKVFVRKLGESGRAGPRSVSSPQWKVGEKVRQQDTMGRALRHEQLEGVEFLKKRHESGFRANMLFVSTGSGKTLTILSYLIRLNQQKMLPRYVVITVPASALDNMIHEVLALFPRVRILDPTKQKSSKTLENVEIVKVRDVLGREGELLEEKTIHIVRHDHIRMKPTGSFSLADALVPYAHQMFFVVDEFHQLLAVDALKTAAALQIASACKELAILSATPCKDSRIKTIMPWLSMLVEFEVTEGNFFFAMNAAFAKIIRTGIPRKYITEIVNIDNDDTEYYNLAPPGLGGTNRNFPSDDSLKKIFNIAYAYVTRGFVRLTSHILHTEAQSRVFIVCRNKDHQKAVASALLEANAIPGGEEYVHIMSKTIMLTPSIVASGQETDYKVVIGTMAMNAGFSLTTCNVMLTAPYPSNEANRTQMLGRIDRFGSQATELRYYTVVAGLLLNMKRRQDEDASWRQAMEDLAKPADC